MVWHDLVWHDGIWHVVGWHDMVRFDLMLRYVTGRDMMSLDALRHDPVWHKVNVTSLQITSQQCYHPLRHMFGKKLDDSIPFVYGTSRHILPPSHNTVKDDNIIINCSSVRDKLCPFSSRLCGSPSFHLDPDCSVQWLSAPDRETSGCEAGLPRRTDGRQLPS